MTCEEFLGQSRKMLDAFELFWVAGHTRDAGNFPLFMNEADWLEQLSIFIAISNETTEHEQPQRRPA